MLPELATETIVFEDGSKQDIIVGEIQTGDDLVLSKPSRRIATKILMRRTAERH